MYAESLSETDLLLRKIRRLSLSQAVSQGAEPDDAEDLAQEAVVRAWLSLSSYHGRGKLSSWTWVIVRNLRYEFERRATARRRAERTSLLLHPRTERGPDDVLNYGSVLGLLTQLILSLPASQRLAVAATWEGYTAEELALATNVSAVTVRANLSKGRRKLRAALAAPNTFSS